MALCSLENTALPLCPAQLLATTIWLSVLIIRLLYIAHMMESHSIWYWVCVCVCVAHFTEYNVLKAHSCCRTCQNLLLIPSKAEQYFILCTDLVQTLFYCPFIPG